MPVRDEATTYQPSLGMDVQKDHCSEPHPSEGFVCPICWLVEFHTQLVAASAAWTSSALKLPEKGQEEKAEPVFKTVLWLDRHDIVSQDSGLAAGNQQHCPRHVHQMR